MFIWSDKLHNLMASVQWLDIILTSWRIAKDHIHDSIYGVYICISAEEFVQHKQRSHNYIFIVRRNENYPRFPSQLPTVRRRRHTEAIKVATARKRKISKCALDTEMIDWQISCSAELCKYAIKYCWALEESIEVLVL